MARASGSPLGLAIDATHIYWSQRPDSAADATSIVRLAKSGGEPEVLASSQRLPGYRPVLALTADSVVWATLGTLTGQWRDGAIMEVPKKGGTPVNLARAPMVTGLVVHGSEIYWLEAAPGSASATAIARMSTRGARPQLLATRRAACCLAVDSANVYWLETDSKSPVESRVRVAAVAKSGGPVRELTSFQQGTAWGLVVDEALYWATGTEVRKAPKNGGDPISITPPQRVGLHQLLDGGKALYWYTTLLSDDSEALWRVPKDGAAAQRAIERLSTPGERTGAPTGCEGSPVPCLGSAELRNRFLLKEIAVHGGDVVWSRHAFREDRTELVMHSLP
jgi:hypothetical protein